MYRSLNAFVKFMEWLIDNERKSKLSRKQLSATPYSDGEKIAATDGKCIAWMDAPEECKEPGYYTYVKPQSLRDKGRWLPYQNDAEFPKNWKNCIPREETLEKLYEGLPADEKLRQFETQVKVAARQKWKYAMNEVYLTKIMATGIGFSLLAPEDGPVLFRTEAGTNDFNILLMPLCMRRSDKYPYGIWPELRSLMGEIPPEENKETAEEKKEA